MLTYFRPNELDYWEEYWLPKVKVFRNPNTKKALPKTVSQLVPYLRLAYCDSPCIDLRLTHVIRYKDCEAIHDAIFGDLVAPTTVVNILTICAEDDRQHELPALLVEADHILDWRNADDRFFASAAKCGVRSISCDAAAISLLPALSFAFAEPLDGSNRRVSGVECVTEDVNFLAEIIKKASVLDRRQRIDFKFSIGGLSCAVDPAGFENYRKDDRTWIVGDLENGVMLNVVAERKSTEVHVFS
ncbi:hypothetical protein AAVH_24504 [Aphelenchoides avenae]|nr:hypothetical protein AAVH_24504 [Aphelenchus avenae]